MRLESKHPRRRSGLMLDYACMLLESLESRQLLSTTLVPELKTLSVPPALAASFSGYSPAEIRHAYGFDQVAGDGTGQTIAIVTAYHDPKIAADLATFDSKFGLPDPTSLKVVSQTGGSPNSLKTDAGWASETALDVEWAHAIAPKANILVVEANSSSLSNLAAAVDYARHAPDVSVVSMSWGGSEFYGQSQYNSLFRTPQGHIGVTFVAASGDSGSWGGPSWPASSPNVLSVGGTSLLTADSVGNYLAEYGWSGSGGGISSFEPQPSYQLGAQHTGGRTTPDVSYNANPYTGFAFYSSVADQGSSGWQIVGGTSAGAPQWAALVAIANEVRVAAGKATLDGASNTLPLLYSMYHAPGSGDYATYTATFDDIRQGQSSYFLGAHAGYDGVTGLGSPNVPAVIAALAEQTAPAPTASRVRVRMAALRSRPAEAILARQAPGESAVSDVDDAVSPTAAAANAPGRVAPAAFGAIATDSTLRSLFSTTPLFASPAASLGIADEPRLLSRSIAEVAGVQHFPFATERVVESLSQILPGQATELAMMGPSSAMQIAATAVPRVGQMLQAAAATEAVAGLASEALAAVMTPFATDPIDSEWPVIAAALAVGAVVTGYSYAAWRKRKAFSVKPLVVASGLGF